jgi:hypothetical protein
MYKVATFLYRKSVARSAENDEYDDTSLPSIRQLFFTCRVNYTHRYGANIASCEEAFNTTLKEIGCTQILESDKAGRMSLYQLESLGTLPLDATVFLVHVVSSSTPQVHVERRTSWLQNTRLETVLRPRKLRRTVGIDISGEGKRGWQFLELKTGENKRNCEDSFRVLVLGMGME